MNVLVIGSGGREHALVWKLAQSDHVEHVYCSPGNGGMIADGITCIPLSDFHELAKYCLDHDVGLVVVGPEKPLCDGIVDLFRNKGITIFGPTKAAAQLEGSKWFAKEFMWRHGIPTGKACLFTDAKSAVDYIGRAGAPIVVKANGLASGKGVTVAFSEDAAVGAVENCFSGAFGRSGEEVIIEECLDGEEASILAFVDNHCIKPLASSQDHKRLKDADKGPNTGGMGAYSPANIINESSWEQIERQILTPFLKGCQNDGLDYRGLIYAGIMVTENGPKVLEFNVRFGDPEAQAVLYRLESDLAEAMLNSVENKLSHYEFHWSKDPAACVVLVSEGYPGKYQTGYRITGIKAAESAGATVFHAGTEFSGSEWITSGGRVLGITSRGRTAKEAAGSAYEAIKNINWPGMYFRRDIANKATD